MAKEFVNSNMQSTWYTDEEGGGNGKKKDGGENTFSVSKIQYGNHPLFDNPRLKRL